MNETRRLVFDASLKPEGRLEALSAYFGSQPVRQGAIGGSNNHIHTCYSFSPYTPSAAALMAWEAGLEAAGSVDHDAIAAAPEMRAAAALLGLGSVSGCEVRVAFDAAPFNGIKINSPDAAGIAYMTIQAVPHSSDARLDSFLKPIRAARLLRTRRMTDAVNQRLAGCDVRPLDFDTDVLALSKFSEGGEITERHLLYAVARLITDSGASALDFFAKRLGVALSEKQKALICANDADVYDMLGVLKASFLEDVFIAPVPPEIVSAEAAVAAALSVDAVPAYAYLGDVGDSVTGDKKPEKFEDDYLDDLFPVLRDYGYKAVTYMPPRNTRSQLARVQSLCAQYDFMEISGVDVNQPRQSFTCPELLLQEFRNLNDSTWALAAHEKAAAVNPDWGLFSRANPLAALPLPERIQAYADVGRRMVQGGETLAVLIERFKRI